MPTIPETKMSQDESLYCPQCQRYTHLHKLTSTQNRNRLCAQTYECNYCARLFLITYNKNGLVIETLPNSLPQPINEKMPDFLKSDIKEIYNCFSVKAYRATGAMARRTLEICCIKKKAKGATLAKK